MIDKSDLTKKLQVLPKSKHVFTTLRFKPKTPAKSNTNNILEEIAEENHSNPPNSKNIPNPKFVYKKMGHSTKSSKDIFYAYTNVPKESQVDKKKDKYYSLTSGEVKKLEDKI